MNIDSDKLETRLRWSPWSRCESSFSLWLMPNLPGVFVLAEEVIAPGEAAVLGERRMLAVLHIAAADDLARAVNRLFVASEFRDRLQEQRCFIRYAVIASPADRMAVCTALANWLANTGADAQPAPETTTELDAAAATARAGGV